MCLPTHTQEEMRQPLVLQALPTLPLLCPSLSHLFPGPRGLVGLCHEATLPPPCAHQQ